MDDLSSTDLTRRADPSPATPAATHDGYPTIREGSRTAGERADRRSVDERRDQLVDATIEVVAEQGLARATTRRITDHAGLALGVFHYAFHSKEELLEAVIERVSSKVVGALYDAVDGPVDDVNDAIGKVVTGFWEFISQAPELQLAAYELTLHALREPSLRPLALKQYDRYAAAIGAAIDQGQDAPTGQQREDLARYVMATIDGLVLHSFVDSDGPAGAERRLELCLQAVDSVTAEHRSVAV